MLVDRFQAELKQLRANNRAGKSTAIRKLKEFITTQEQFLAHMNREMLNYEDVVEGILPEEDMPADRPQSEGQSSSKRRRLD